MLGLFHYSALIHKIYHVIKSREKLIKSYHENKFQSFGLHRKGKTKFQSEFCWKVNFHNFSLYNFTQEEHEALSYGLDHILTNINRNNITEYESFFQNLLYDLSDMPDNEISKLKTKLRNTREKYYPGMVPYI